MFIWWALAATLLTTIALVRIWLTVRAPTSWRIALTVAVFLLAVAVDANLFQRQVDQLTSPNGSRLVIRVLISASAGATLVYVALLRQERLSARQFAAYIGSTVAACAIMIVGWSMTSFPPRWVPDLTPLAVEPGYALHSAAYYVWLVFCQALIAWFCFGNAWSLERDVTRLVGLRVIGLGCAAGAFLYSVSLFFNVAQFVTGDFQVGPGKWVSVLLPYALVTIAVGLFIMVIVPRGEVGIRAIQRIRHLRALHSHLITLHPDVHLTQTSVSLVHREQRLVIEILDALELTNVARNTPATLQGVGLSLRNPVEGGVSASSLLRGQSSPQELATIAKAFMTADRSHHNAPIP